MNYCTLLFGHAYDTHLKVLEVAQKKSVRVIANENYFAHTNPIFIDLKILKFKDIYKHKVGIYMYKNIDSFSRHLPSHDYETRSGNSLNAVNQRLTLTQRQSLQFQGPIIWNSIPDNIRNAPSLNIFKKQYKQFLLSSYENVE